MNQTCNTIRPVRSYVRRQSHMSASQRNAIDHYWSKYGLELDKGKCDYKAVFPTPLPLLLDIGFGMGDSLIECAMQYPHYNFLGVEVHKPGVGALLAKIESYQLSNVKVYWSDAIEVLNQAVPSHSLQGVLLFFPDPWPKRRHHKRRLIQANFLELIASRLIKGGIIQIATDWEDYAVYIKNQFSMTNLFSQISEQLIERPLTKYEKRGYRLGHSIWDFSYRLID